MDKDLKDILHILKKVCLAEAVKDKLIKANLKEFKVISEGTRRRKIKIGSCVVEFESEISAKLASEAMNGYRVEVLSDKILNISEK